MGWSGAQGGLGDRYGPLKTSLGLAQPGSCLQVGRGVIQQPTGPFGSRFERLGVASGDQRVREQSLTRRPVGHLITIWGEDRGDQLDRGRSPPRSRHGGLGARLVRC